MEFKSVEANILVQIFLWQLLCFAQIMKDVSQ